MKKSIYFGALLLAVLTSCTKENSQGIEVEGQHSFRINTTAPCLETDDADTKASMKATVRLQWNDGDEISVVNLSTGKTMLGNLTAKVNGDKVSFEGELSGSIKAGNKMAAIYPCQNYSGITTVPDFALDLSNQTCSTKDDLNFAAYSLFDCKTTGVVEVTSDFVVPVSFNQITLATIDPETKIDYVELTNVGNGISFHVNSSEGKLKLTPCVGKVRITPQSKLSEKNGALFAYCALAESPASSRAVTVKALPKIYYATWAESAMSASKFYTSIASDFETQEYKDFMVSAPSSLEVGYQGGTVSFSLTSNNISWTASSTPSLTIAPSSGKGCENLEIVVTIPKNDEAAERSFLVTLVGGSDEYHFTINQKADPAIEIIEFPDINLKKYMIANYDEDGDGEISIREADNITTINCPNKSIADLTGLEICPNIIYLNVANNSITELDAHNWHKVETIICYGNNISDLNLDQCKMLTTLNIVNQTTNAKSSSVELDLKYYKQSNSLKISTMSTGWTDIYFDECALAIIDVSSTEMKSIFIRKGPSLTDLSLPSTTTKLVMTDCPLKKYVDVTSCTSLRQLFVNNCALTKLDVSKNPALIRLNCYENKITSLALSNNSALQAIDCNTNSLKSLNLRNNPNLTSLNISNNTALTTLTLENNSLIESLDISNTAIANVILSNLTVLKTLKCANCNSLTNLDPTKCIAMQSIDVRGCPSLSSLDVSKNISLTSLNVSNCTLLTSLDVSKNTLLPMLDISNCTSLATLEVSKIVKIIVSKGMKSSIYQIGQYVSIEGVTGVAFSSEKIISTDQASEQWGYYENKTSATSKTDGAANTDKIAKKSDAAKWCRAKGSAWYLPAYNEMGAILDVRSTLNSTLSEISGTTVAAPPFWSYWTSSAFETNDGKYETYYFNNVGHGLTIDRLNKLGVIAVRAL